MPDDPLDLGEIEPGEIQHWESRDGKSALTPDGVRPRAAQGITAKQFRDAVDAIVYTADHPGLGHVDWPDELDAWTIAHTVLTAAGFELPDSIQIERPL